MQLTIKNSSEVFTEYVSENYRNVNSQDNAKRAYDLFKVYVSKYWNARSLDTASSYDIIKGFRDDYLKVECGYQNVTVNLYLTLTKQFFSWLFDMGYIANGTHNLVKGLKVKTGEQKTPAQDEGTIRKALALLETETATETMDYVTLLLLISTGMRRNEIRNLKIKDLVWIKEKGIFHVSIRHGKRDKDRDVALSPTTSKKLEELIIKLETFFGPMGSNEYLLRSTSSNGISSKRKPVAPSTINRSLKRVGDKIGVSDFTPHSMRRTLADMLNERNVADTDIANQLGHESVETTRRYFSKKSKLKKSEEIAIDLGA